MSAEGHKRSILLLAGRRPTSLVAARLDREGRKGSFLTLHMVGPARAGPPPRPGGGEMCLASGPRLRDATRNGISEHCTGEDCAGRVGSLVNEVWQQVVACRGAPGPTAFRAGSLALVVVREPGPVATIVGPPPQRPSWRDVRSRTQGGD